MSRIPNKTKISISELKKKRESFFSDCCKGGFTSKSNGLWTYYVCNDCLKKTEPINGKGKMLDLHGLVKSRSKKK